MAGKKLHRLNKSKGKRWKKGQSSSSNPEGKAFRQQARNASLTFQTKTGPSQLTQEALRKHTAVEADASIGDIDADNQSQHSVTTWATNYTHCTNKSFSKVLRYENSPSELHKDIVAVLAAVTEVIKTQGGQESDTEYFSALMTALDTADDMNTLSAVTYLLSLCISKVPSSVLQSRFPDISKKLTELLSHNAEEGSVALLKSLLLSLATLLRHQEMGVWRDSSTLNSFSLVLHFVNHDKPKVRKAAHHAVCAVVRGSKAVGEDTPHHPAAKPAAQFCCRTIEQNAGAQGARPTLHALSLLRDVMPVLPQSSFRSSAETVLRAMTLANPVVKATCLRVFHGMFRASPSSDTLTSQLNAQIISALYDFEPSEGDSQAIVSWLAATEAAYLHLHTLDEQLCLSHLPRFFKTCMGILQNGRTESATPVAASMQHVISDALGPAVCGDGKIDVSPTSHVAKVFSCLEAGLSYQFHTVWPLVLKTLASFFQHVAPSAFDLVKKCLVSLADLRDSHRFSYRSELDAAVAAAISSLGPRRILQAIPLRISPDSVGDLARSWLLPLLRDHVRGGELAFFSSHLLPLAASLRQKWIALQEAGGSPVEAKTFELLQQQVWSLLPAFCASPPDITTAFTPAVARLLGSALDEYTDVRLDVLAAVRRLVTHSAANESDKARLAGYAKNYLPKLFNLYSSEGGATGEVPRVGWKLAVLETVKTYVTITDSQLVMKFMDHALQTALDHTATLAKRIAVFDLIIAMAPYSDTDHIEQLVTVTSSLLESDERSLQKKAYRVLEEICSSPHETCRQYVGEHLPQLQNTLATSLAASGPAAKAPRLRCLVQVIKQLEEPQWDFLLAVLPEAILCVRETAERARAAAYNLLSAMAQASCRWHGGSRQDGIRRFVQVLSAGYAGSPQLVATTALALAHIVHEYTEDITGDVAGDLIEQVCLLLKSKAREVVLSTLGLATLLVKLLSDALLGPKLRHLVESLVVMREENGHHFRFKAKDVYTRLIRKFSYETIIRLVPQSQHKMLNNIRKETERKMREREERRDKAKGGRDEEEEEDLRPAYKPETFDELLQDDSDLEDKKGDRKRKAGDPKSRAAWLQESEDTAMDFMDPSASKHVLATRPGRGEGEKGDAGESGASGDFRRAPDGRLIITNLDLEDSDDEAPKKKRKRRRDSDDDDEDLEDLLGALSGNKKRKGKEPRAVDSDDDEGTNRSTYQAGGRGIHRPLKSQDTPATSGGDKFKAKKGRGDVKQKGKVDPYAYIPLKHSTLNKRKQAKLKGQFKGIVGAAQTGATKGHKMKKKGRK